MQVKQVIPNFRWHESKRIALRGTPALPAPGFRRWQRPSNVSDDSGMGQQGILGIDMQISGAECVWVDRVMICFRFRLFFAQGNCQSLLNAVAEE